MKDIAKRAKVSMMTVSRVINHSGYVSEATREAVETAIADLNYRPNLAARSLINRRSSFVYTIVPDISNPFYADLTKGVEHVARKAGYHMILSNGHWNEALEEEHIEAAQGRMAEGVILVLPKLAEKRIAQFHRRIPLVVVDKHVRSRSIDSVYVEQDYGASLAVEHLIALGHRRIAFLSGPQRIYNSVARRHGYERALLGHGIQPDPALVLHGDFSFESGEAAFNVLLGMGADVRPSAVFAASDLMAMGLMRSAFRHSFRIPEDLSIVGFDDISLSSIINPPLTTVRHPFIRMGEVAMHRLLEKINPNAPRAEPKPLVNTLIVRETTGAPRSRT